jgi:Spy/CpxP family protein refolding chaperone
MSDASEKDIVRIDLTDEQKDQIKAATEKSAEAIELTVQELEARIAPRALFTD